MFKRKALCIKKLFHCRVCEGLCVEPAVKSAHAFCDFLSTVQGYRDSRPKCGAILFLFSMVVGLNT